MEDWTYQEHFDMEDRHWWFRSRRRVIWALIHRAQPRSSPRILDAGCGTGRNLMDFQSLGPAEGVDLSREAIDFCQRRGLHGVREAPIEELPYEDARFDLLFATDVIEHLPDDGPALTELRRVAAPGASLIITVPATITVATRAACCASASSRTVGSPRSRATSTARCCPRWPSSARFSASARTATASPICTSRRGRSTAGWSCRSAVRRS
jgi:SAM-dependent methyltransferase